MDELTRLLFPAQDFARIEARPVYPFDTLQELFDEDTETAAAN